MKAIVIKIVDRDRPDQAAEALGELQGAGFNITYQDDADGLEVDATKQGSDSQAYGPSFVIIGKK
jgi:hypothetical protein